MATGSSQAGMAGMGTGAMAGMMVGGIPGAVVGAGLGYYAGSKGYLGGTEKEWNPTEKLLDIQEPYLRQQYAEAQRLYDQTKNLSPYEEAGYARGQAFYGAGGAGDQLANQLGQQGGQLSSMGMQGMQDFMSRGPEQIRMDYTNIDRSINNQLLQQQIDAATSGQYRQFREEGLKGTSLQGAARGTAGGSRGHQMEAILGRGALESSQNIAAQLRGQAWNQAYGTEAQRAASQAQMNQGWYGQQGQMGMGMLQQGTGMQMQGYQVGGNNIAQQLALGHQQRMSPWEAHQMFQQGLGQPIMQSGGYGPSGAQQNMAMLNYGLSNLGSQYQNMYGTGNQQMNQQGMA